MQKEVSILLDKMGIDYTNSSFFDSLKLEKVVVEEKSGEWDIYLNNETLLDVEAYKELEENKEDTKYLESKIISVEEIFKNKEKIKLDDKKMQLFLNGVKITQNQENDIYRIYDKNEKFIGIGIVQDKLLKRDIILD